MTVQTTGFLARHDGDGSTVAFDIPFRFLGDAELSVALWVDGVATDWTLATDYTVTGAGAPAGGVLTAAVAPAAGAKLTILRTTDARQLSNYEEQDGFPKATIERDQDRRAMLDQEQAGGLARTIRAPAVDETFDGVLPYAPQRSGMLAGFTLDGTKVRMVSPQEVAGTENPNGAEDYGFFGEPPSEPSEDFGAF